MAGRSRAWLDVDLDALKRNAECFRAASGMPILPMIKADAYGLGAAAVVQVLEGLDPWGYGIATVEEGAELRRLGIQRPLVVFTPLYPQILHGCRVWDLRPSIGSLAMLEAWLEFGGGPFHLAVDTGMSRSGIQWWDETIWKRLIPRIDGRPEFEGIYTHFHSAGEDEAACRLQTNRLLEVVARFRQRPRLVHLANSAAPLQAGFDLARPGIFLYGVSVPGLQAEPVAAFRAVVAALRRVSIGTTVSYGATWTAKRETTVATIAVGYADGVLRALSNRGEIELAGRACPIIGRVTMDLTMIDAADLLISVGDVATIYGGLVTVERAASLADTIPYELLVSVGNRIPRFYRRGE